MKRSMLIMSLIAAAFVNAATNVPTAKASNSSAREEVPKVEREGVWQPSSGGEQVPLWPENVALAKPDSGDNPEATGNGALGELRHPAYNDYLSAEGAQHRGCDVGDTRRRIPRCCN